MRPITSQRSGKFYLSIILSVLFCLVMALMTGALHKQATSEVGEVIMVLVSIALVFGAFYVVIRFYKNAPKITVDKESISFNNSTYHWKNLENIEMTGKRPFKFFGQRREGALLKFRGQDEVYIFDSMYSNSGQIKKFIQCIIDNVEYEEKELTAPVIEKVNEEHFITYKGVQIFNLRAIAMWLYLLGLSVFLVSKWNSVGIWIFTFTLGNIIFWFISWFMYYFKVSENYIQVRNHNRFWVKDIYAISDVREIVFEQWDRMPNCLRIITNDFKSKQYPAATLRNKTWRQLKEDLEKQGIKVRNECIPEYVPFEFKLFDD